MAAVVGIHPRRHRHRNDVRRDRSWRMRSMRRTQQGFGARARQI